MIRFACPGCGGVFTVGDDKAGKTGRCPRCAAHIEIPAPVPPAPAAVVAAPPPSPPVAAAVVELACPACGGRLVVDAADVGEPVECPFCQGTFVATRPPPAPPPPAPAWSLAASDDRPSRRNRIVEDDEDDPRPKKKAKRKPREMVEHRGGLVLTYALLGMFCCIVFTFVALNMANEDLARMGRGRMDPSGRGTTNAARIICLVTIWLTIIGVVLNVLGLLVGVLIGLANAA